MQWYKCNIGNTGQVRISGGQVPPEGKYPSLVRMINIHHNRPECAGTILNREWILTSGICFAWKKNTIIDFSNLRVVVGDAITNETEPYEQIHEIERVIIHEDLKADELDL